MFTKVPPVCWKILGILFTSILAPVGIRHFDDTSHELPSAESLPAVLSLTEPQEPAPSATRIRAKGTGASPDAAFQNALDTALHQAITAEVSAADWQQHKQTYLASFRQDGTGVLHGWREVSSSSERHLTGRVFHSEVSVEVNVEALRRHLQSARQVTRH